MQITKKTKIVLTMIHSKLVSPINFVQALISRFHENNIIAQYKIFNNIEIQQITLKLFYSKLVNRFT